MSDKSFLMHARDDMKNWRQQLDELRVKASLAKAELRDAMQPEMDRLQLEIEHLEKLLAPLSEHTDAALGELRRGVEHAVGELSLGFREAVDRIKG